MSGYITSGRFRADISKEAAIDARRAAHRCLRWGLRSQHRRFMNEALREWRLFKHYRGRIVS